MSVNRTSSAPVTISAMVPAVDSAPVVSWVWWFCSESMTVSPAWVS